MNISKKLPLCFFLLIGTISHCTADIWLPSIFGDHMVLQAEKPIAIWGRAIAGETVQVELQDASGSVISKAQPTMTAANGEWSVTLPEVPAGQLVSMRIKGSESEERLLSDILSGEVWLCSGQSNMRWMVYKSLNAEDELAAADHPEIRLFLVDFIHAETPLDNLKGQWVICTPKTISEFSGLAYFFGRELHQQLKRPVGLICSAIGGTPIQAWTPLEPMVTHPATSHIYDDFVAYYATPPEQRRKTRDGKWIYGNNQMKGPARLYNGMIHPLIPLSIRGITWCQGEANSKPRGGMGGGAVVYRVHFPMMIKAWREQWNEPDLPFFYVELSNYREPQKTPVSEEEGHHWGPIREAQAEALKLKNVYPVSTIDIGEADDIHYKNKQEAGKRLALATLGALYEQAESPYLSPRYASHVIEHGRIRIRLHNAGSLNTDDGQAPAAFAIRGSETDWKWASTAIKDDQILVWHPEIKEPVAVRHAWASNPDVNVYNGASLPLMPFRTDGGD